MTSEIDARLFALRLELARQEREPPSYYAAAQVRFLARMIREVEEEIAHAAHAASTSGRRTA